MHLFNLINNLIILLDAALVSFVVKVTFQYWTRKVNMHTYMSCFEVLKPSIFVSAGCAPGITEPAFDLILIFL